VPVSQDGLNSRLSDAGFSNISVINRSGGIRIRAERIADVNAKVPR
jgi:hypothetical protein